VDPTTVFPIAAAQRAGLNEARRVYLSEVQRAGLNKVRTVCRNVVDPRMVFPIAVARTGGPNEVQRAGLNVAQRDVRTSPDAVLRAHRAGRHIASPAIWNPAPSKWAGYRGGRQISKFWPSKLPAAHRTALTEALKSGVVPRVIPTPWA